MWDVNAQALVNELNPCAAYVNCLGWAINPEMSRGAAVVALENRSEERGEAGLLEGGGYSSAQAAQFPDPRGIVIFDLNSGSPLKIINIADLFTNAFYVVRNLRFSQDGSTLAAEIAGGAGTVVWDVVTGERLRIIEAASSFALSSDGQVFAANGIVYSNGEYLSTIRVSSVRSGQTTSIADFERATLLGLAFVPRSSLLVSTYNDGYVRVWDTQSQVTVATVATNASFSYGIAVSLDGSHIAITSQEGNVQLFSVNSNLGYETRPLNLGEDTLNLIFDPTGCLLVNGHELIVKEIQRELQVLDDMRSSSEKTAEILRYLAPRPLVGEVESLRRQVEAMMLDVNPRCTSEYFAYRVGDSQRGIRFVDPSGLGNIAYGYFLTRFALPQWSQDIVADIQQRFNPGTWVEAVRQCGFDRDCIVFFMTVVGDNPDDRRQRFVGEQMARSTLPLTIDLFVRYANTYSLY